jgi:hypothetical protein
MSSSTKAQMIFYYPKPLGKITIQVLDRRRRKCSWKDPYANPIFDFDTILEKLYERIGWDFYNKPKLPKKRNDSYDEEEDPYDATRGVYVKHVNWAFILTREKFSSTN